MTKAIEHITNNEQIIAIVLRKEFNRDGIEFVTPSHFSQQLGYMRRPKGYTIPPHVHNAVLREVHVTNEVLFIKSGAVRVDFYGENKCYLESRILNQGDVILLASGGHGFEMLEPSEIIEVKQGPYSGEADKTRFDSVTLAQVNLGIKP
jgi:mannose-6-phosphate isomerase-like protein (cupin superfamily)